MAVPSFAEQDLKAKRLQEANAFVKQYFKLEEERGYERAYDFLSSTFKQALMQEDNVKNGREYKKLREVKGLRWMRSRIEDISFDSQFNAAVVVTTEYEQQVYGEHIVYGKVDLATIVVWKNDKPSIDSITLSKVH